MAEKLRQRFFLKGGFLIPLLLLLLVFPPVLRDEFLRVQRVQLVFFFLAGVSVYFLFHRGQRDPVEWLLLLLFIGFPLVYALAGVLHGYPLFVILKEVLYFGMPLWMYVIFRKTFAVSGRMNVLIWFALASATLLVLALSLLYLCGAFISRNLFRWESLYICYPVLLPAFWAVAGDGKISRKRKGYVLMLIFLGLLATLGRRELIGAGALLLFVAGGFFQSEKRMRIWILILATVPVFYFMALYHGVQLPGKSFKRWRVYEVQTFVQSSGPDHWAFWVGNGFGWELPVKRTLHVHNSDTLSEINKFHDFWLYLFAKTGVIGTLAFLAALLFLLLFVNQIQFRSNSGRIPVFLLGYLAFLCFIAWNYDGGFPMAFQQGALFGMTLALVRMNGPGFGWEKGNL